MLPTYFKFTTPEGLNRRLTFSEPPTWPLLASKLHDLCGISLDNVGVSYVDNDNDEITLSSDEELQEFYKMSHQAGQVIKFSVVDLAGKPLEFPSLNQNPFDGDPFEFVGEWERLPPDVITKEDRSESGPHAFVEVLSGNNSVAHDHTHEMDTDTEDDHSTIQTPSLNKGKGRALSFGAASITSVLGEEMAHKHPIHVYDLNSRREDKSKDNNSDDPSVHIRVAAQSTPKVQAKDIDDETPAPSKAVEVEDPPLPSLDESPASATSASLFHDLASLVHDVTQVVSSHPELSEGLHNIGRNISNGAYWTTHREALSQAVNEMSNPLSTEEHHQAEEAAAARRLTDVVGNFFRTLSQVPVGTADTRAPNTNGDRPDQYRGENLASLSSPWPWWAFQGMRSRAPMSGHRGSRYHGHFPRYGPFPPHGLHAPRPPPFPFHHAPPPPPHAPSGAPPSHHPSTPTNDHPCPALPPADPPVVQGNIPPPPPSVPPPNESPAPMPGVQPGMQSHGPSVNDRRQSYQGPFASFFPVSGDQQSSRPNAQDLRAQVEAAKHIYKAEKERYRQERELRRRERFAHKSTVRHSATAAAAQAEMSSIQFQNMYPEVERVGVPRRSNTHLGHGPFRHVDKKPEDLTTRAVVRIAKKLSDMGFSENAYPGLPEKIKAQMPPTGAISKEAEDDVVTTLLEELLTPASPRPNVASGSGQRDIDMAEAWH